MDNLNQCVSCRSFDLMLKGFDTFAANFYGYLVGPLSGLMGTVLGIWMLVTIAKAVSGKQVIWPQVIEDLVLFALFFGILWLPSTWTDATSAIRFAAGQIGQEALFRASGVSVAGTGWTGLVAIVAAVERELSGTLWNAAWSVLGDLSIWGSNLRELLIGFLMAILFIGVIFVFVFTIMVSIVNIMAINILAPFILAFGAFPWTRGIFFEAARLFITESLKLIVAAGVAGLMIGLAADFTKTPDTRGDAIAYLGSAEVVGSIVSAFMILLMYRRLVDLPTRIIKIASDTVPQLGLGRLTRPPQFGAGRPGGSSPSGAPSGGS